MAHLICAADADEAWRSAATLLLADSTKRQASRAGETAELLQVTIEIQDPRQRWVVSRHPAINPAFALVEVVWILQGREDARLPTYFNPALPRFSGRTPAFHGAYGNRLRRSLGIDQLLRAKDALQANPDSRQVALQIWDGRLDLPNVDGTPAAADIPCNVLSLLKVRDGKLNWTQILRSNDIHLGFPHNIIQWTAMHEIVAGWLGVGLGTYTHFADSLHAYTRDLSHYQSVDPVVVVPNTDSLMFPYDYFNELLGELGRRVDLIANEAVASQDVVSLGDWPTVPESIQNILRVIAADGLRRRSDASAADTMMAACTNGTYMQLWKRWIARVAASAVAVANRP